MQATLFTNARLVGWTSEEGQTYSVLVKDGMIKSITPGKEKSQRSAQALGTDLVDLAKEDGSGYWLGPVSKRKQFECKTLQVTVSPSARASSIVPALYSILGIRTDSQSLVDHHTHFSISALTSRRLDLQSATSARQVLDQVREALLSVSDEERLDPDFEPNFVGVNLRNADWPDAELITRQALDQVAPSHSGPDVEPRPIFLIYNGYHSMCLNSPALRLAGYEPEGHSGLLLEQEAFDLMKMLSTAKEEVLDKWVQQEAEAAAALGVTGIVDLEWDFNVLNWQRRYHPDAPCLGRSQYESSSQNEASASSALSTFTIPRQIHPRKLRVQVGFYDAHLPSAISDGYKTGDIVPGTNGLVTIGPYKVITDGSLGSQTAYCHDAYPGSSPPNYGIIAHEPQSLATMTEHATSHGFRLAIHAIGDHANHLALKTLASSAEKGIKPLAGSTIEHAQLLDFDDLPMFKQTGLIASIQPCHLVDDRQLCHRFWPGREGRAYAFKSIVDAGIPIKLGSDCPVAPLQPWEAMAVAISRVGAKEREGEKPFCEEQIIDIETAWAASTSNGKIRLEVGDAADLCVLGSNPLQSDAAGLRNMYVRGTMLAGGWTHWSASE